MAIVYKILTESMNTGEITAVVNKFLSLQEGNFCQPTYWFNYIEGEGADLVRKANTAIVYKDMLSMAKVFIDNGIITYTIILPESSTNGKLRLVWSQVT